MGGGDQGQQYEFHSHFAKNMRVLCSTEVQEVSSLGVGVTAKGRVVRTEVAGSVAP